MEGWGQGGVLYRQIRAAEDLKKACNRTQKANLEYKKCITLVIDPDQVHQMGFVNDH